MKKNCNLLSPFNYLISSRVRTFVFSFPRVVEHHDLHLFSWDLASLQASSHLLPETNLKKKVFKITIPKVFMIITTLGFLGLPCAPVGLQNSQLLTSCKTVLFLKLLEAMHGQHPLFSFKKVQLLFYFFIFTKLIHPIDTINHSYI